MKFLLSLLVGTGLATSVAAGPFDDLSDADRAAFGAQVRAYLLENPEVLVEVISVLEQRQALEADAATADVIAANRAEIFEDGVSHVAGNPEGDVTIVEFLDYQCGFCKRAHPEVAALLESDGDIRLIQKEFPILGPVSETASRAALAVLIGQGDDIYAEFTDRLMRHNGPLNAGAIDRIAADSGADVAAMNAMAGSPDVSAIIERNRALGAALSVTGTPSFIIGDEMVRGYMPFEQMEAMVAERRSEM